MIALVASQPLGDYRSASATPGTQNGETTLQVKSFDSNDPKWILDQHVSSRVRSSSSIKIPKT
eukprot:4548690-Amphidinium_carterae.1